MVVLVIGWLVLSVLLGVLVGKGIHRADAVGSRTGAPWWELPSPSTLAGADITAPADRSDARPAAALAV